MAEGNDATFRTHQGGHHGGEPIRNEGALVSARLLKLSREAWKRPAHTLDLVAADLGGAGGIQTGPDWEISRLQKPWTKKTSGRFHGQDIAKITL